MDRVVWNALEVDASGALRIAHFRPSMQEAFQWLVLDGLAERWGSVDEFLNPDLRDIDARYGEDIVLVALDDEQVVGTGILVLRPTAGEIVRMSVHRAHRRRGIASMLVSSLLQLARAQDVGHIEVETNANWTDARAFYEKLGFTFSHCAPGDFGQEALYELDL
jgi:GNAT superfamily N-acetyltransferase